MTRHNRKNRKQWNTEIVLNLDRKHSTSTKEKQNDDFFRVIIAEIVEKTEEIQRDF